MARIYRAPRETWQERWQRRREQAQAADADYQRAQVQAFDARAEASRQVDTGQGQCPFCGSHNVSRRVKSVGDVGPQIAFAVVMALVGFFCLCVGWALIPLAPFLFRHQVTVAFCDTCRAEWPA